MKSILTLILLLILAPSLHAQDYTWDDFVMELSNEVDTDDGALSDDMLDELANLFANPYNINTVTEADLQVLPFLSPGQIRDILDYRDRNKPVLSLGELLSLYSLDFATRSKLRLFLTADYSQRLQDSLRTKPVSSVGQLMKWGHHDVSTRTDIPMYEREGYKGGNDAAYRGSKLYHDFRYRFKSMDHVDAGFQFQKDPGERGIDYYGAYALVKNFGWLRTLVVGDYRASFGQGLVMNTGANYGKTITFSSMGRMNRGLRAHSGMSESGYLNGTGLAINISKHVSATAFWSRRYEEGTMANDKPCITTLKTDGLHRTVQEYGRRHNLTNNTVGGNVTACVKDFTFGLTAVHTHFFKPLMPVCNTPSTLYRLYNAQGQDFANAGIYYMWLGKKIVASGESAYSSSGGFATINSIQLRMIRNNEFTILQRSYGAKYVSIYGNSFSENSRPQNEQACFVGWKNSSLPGMNIESYVDFMYFPWLKYQVGGSSYGMDGMFQAQYAPNRQMTLTVRYKLKSKQRDCTLADYDTDVLRYRTNQSLRLTMQYALTPQFNMKTMLNGVLSSFPQTGMEAGFAISEAVRWTSRKNNTRLEAGVTYFDTESNNARIYAYEPSLLYSFGLMSMGGRGVRTSLFASVALAQRIVIAAKLGCTAYFDRSFISSSHEKIDASHREDLQIQLRWRIK